MGFYKTFAVFALATLTIFITAHQLVIGFDNPVQVSFAAERSLAIPPVVLKSSIAVKACEAKAKNDTCEIAIPNEEVLPGTCQPAADSILACQQNQTN